MKITSRFIDKENNPQSQLLNGLKCTALIFPGKERRLFFRAERHY